MTAEPSTRPMAAPRTGDPARRRPARATALAAAVAAAALVWVVAVPVAGVDLTVTVQGETQSIGLPAVLGTSLVAGLLGWAALAVLESRVPRRAAGLWTAAAGAVTLLSLLGPLTAAGSTSQTVAMIALHLAVAVVLIPLLRRTSGRDFPASTTDGGPGGSRPARR